MMKEMLNEWMILKTIKTNKTLLADKTGGG